MSGQSLKGLSANQLRALRRLEDSFRVSYEELMRRQYNNRAFVLAIITFALHGLRHIIRKAYSYQVTVKSPLSHYTVAIIPFVVYFYFYIKRTYEQNLICASVTRRLEIIE
ncbi:hypothetical protein BgAZ_102930 [Babesia gibsoni]|uniref:Uncharacterized protein n=1 Tax=Babesia gibsoni TaxID=33632 RepID=A0AAD8UTS7_BABGI|nr:hypothetical protein BgAZ_102930 [Babesia gibsoni]